MPIKIKTNNKIYDIKEAVIKQGGLLIRKVPLKMKLSGMIIDFISYGPTAEDIKMLIEVSPDGFDTYKLSKLINALADVVETVVVTFSSGIFLCNSPIEIRRSNVTLVGKGSNTILKLNYSSKPLIACVGNSGNELENLYIFNMTLDCNNMTSSIGIMIQYVGKSYTLTNNSHNLSIAGNTKICKKGITIEDCIIQNQSSGSGIHLTFCSNCIIASNLIQNVYDGIYSGSCSANNISYNIIQNNLNNGMDLTNSHSSIYSNRVRNNANHGVIVFGDRNVLSSNMVQNNSYFGIYLFSTNTNNIISSNNILSNKQGIYLVSSSNCTISSNLIIGNIEYGINTTNNNINNIFSNNSITSNNAGGIKLNVNSDNNILQSNIVRYNSSNQIVDEGNNNTKYHNS